MLGQKSAGPVRHIQLKRAGTTVAKKRAFGTIEAGKYIGPLRAPVGGTLVESNEQVIQNPSLVNQDPYGQGWFVVIEPVSLEEDLKDLVHGEEAVQAWLEQELEDYRKKGLIKE
jgi:glycine cleavage system H protein